MFGEKYSYDDEVCQKINEMSERLVEGTVPLSSGAVLDALPFLFHFKFLFRDTHRKLEVARGVVNVFIKTRIDEAKVNVYKYKCFTEPLSIKQLLIYRFNYTFKLC